MLFGSWEGLKSSDVAIGRLAVILVDWTFFCSMRKWPLLVARDLAKCLVTSDAVRPGHDLKWLRWIARRKVDSIGAKAHAWRKTARSCLVVTFRMAPFTECWSLPFGFVGSVSGRAAFGARGIFQRPLVALRFPTMMTFLSLYSLTSYLVKRATQSSSHNWPKEMRDPDLIPSKMWPTFAWSESSFAKGTMARLVDSMFSPLAT